MNQRNSRFRTDWLTLAIACSICSMVSGCHSFSLKDHFDLSQGIPWTKSAEKRAQPPGRVVAFWTDTVLNQGSNQPQRGFGGRVYFYATGEEEPVRVDGQLVVYAFDETNRDPTNNRPTRRYVFPPEQVAKHYSESDMGPSYSFWLPWDAVGGAQKEVSLIARFESRHGPVVVSRQSRHRLPGSMEPSATQAALAAGLPPIDPSGTSSFPAQQTGYNAAAGEPGHAGGQPPTQQMTTTTISLPSQFGRVRPQAQTIPRSATAQSPNRSPAMRYQPMAGTPAGPAAAHPQQHSGAPATGQSPRVGPPAAYSSPGTGQAQGPAASQPTASRPGWAQSHGESPFVGRYRSWDQSPADSGFSSPVPRATP